MANAARDFFVRFIDAMNARDLDAVDKFIHPEFVGESLQSGEISRGRDGFRAQLRDYPGADVNPISLDEAQLYGADERWAISPGYTVVPLTGSNEFTVTFRSRYPDGSWWRMVLIVELRDDLLYRMQPFFAPELPAPLAESIAQFPHR